MTAALINRITSFVVVGPWIVWLIWELALLWFRGKGITVNTISMEAKRIAFAHLGALAYFWGGMSAHYFLSWKRPVWNSPAPAIAFWTIGAAYLAADLLDRGHWFGWPDFVQWIRWPPVVVLIGLAAGYLLFPQSATWSPK